MTGFCLLCIAAATLLTLRHHRQLLQHPEITDRLRSSLTLIDGWLLAGTLMAIVLVLLLGAWCVYSFHRALQFPTQQMQALAVGKLPLPQDIEPNELARIAKAANQLATNLRQASAFAAAIGEGHLESPYHPVSAADSLGNALLHMRDKLERVADEDRKRNWAAEGLAALADILRTHAPDFTTLTDRIILHLVKYLHANQGGLFTVVAPETAEPYLDLVACYAYERKKYLKKQILPGEGLVGQCFLERDTLYLTDVPPNYVRITSGLGQATPRCILIVPLLANETLEGVIELASLGTFEPHQVQFLEKVAANIASTLATTRVSHRTHELLGESQSQAEQMRAQEEEMRQNLEELQATQDELRRQEQTHLREIERLGQLYEANTVEMTGIFTAINATLATAEFDPRGYALSANENFLRLMRTSLPAMQGKHHRQFVDHADLAHPSYAAFWQALNQGITQAGDFKRIRPDGTEVWMRATYTPVKDRDGNIFKIIKLSHDITERKMAEMQLQTLSLVADNTANSVVITDAQGFIEYVNPSFTRMTGYSLDDCRGQKPGCLLQGPDTDARTIQRIREKTRARESCFEEVLNYTKDGQTYWSSLVINPVFDKEGHLTQFISIQSDVTENKRRSLDFTSQLEAISRANAVVEFDLRGCLQSANENFLQLMEYPLEAVQGQQHQLFVHPEERNSDVYRSFWEALATGQFISGEFRRVTRSGKEVWLKGHYSAILDAHGRPYKVVKYAQDITAQKQLEAIARELAKQMQTQEEVLRQNTEELQTAWEKLERQSLELTAHLAAINRTLATAEFTLEGRILTANENFLQLLRYRSEELLHQPHRMLVEPAYAASAAYEQFWQALRAGKAQTGHVKRVTRDGQEVWLSASYTPVFDRQGKPIKIIKLAQLTESAQGQ